MLPRGLLAVFAFLVVLLLILGWGAGLYVDWLWFGSLGYRQVFRTILLTDFVLRSAGFLLVFFALWANLLLTRPVLVAPLRVLQEGEQLTLEEVLLGRLLRPRRLFWLFAGVSMLLAGMWAMALRGDWAVVQQFLHPVPFGVPDPVFGKDVAFYVFRLPFWKLVYKLLSGAVLLAGLAVALVYLVVVPLTGRRPWDLPAVRLHLSALVAAYFLLRAWGFWLDRYDLLLSERGAVFGAGYTDVHVNLVAYQVLAVLAVVCALAILANLLLRRFRLVIWAVAALAGAWILLGGILPTVVQRFVVEPNEFNRERPYIEHNIAMTRMAYDLDTVERRPFPAGRTLAAADLEANRETIENIRLWDWQPLLQTYGQLQEMRLYYSFKDVDVDRYVIGGRYRQVMLAARELEQKQLAAQARTWVNQRLVYTHGYGVAMSPVNEVTAEGLPHFFLRDIPPAGVEDVRVTRPEIYFGEATEGYVVVKTRTPEFDYPRGEENVYTRYAGEGGVAIGGGLRRLLFALAFGDYRLLVSGNITRESEILYHRTLAERVPRIAPFLDFDRDPYLVISGGRLFWMWDAYTTSTMFPYAEPYEGRKNYIRNAVKVVVDAYNGTVDFYISDPQDPIVQSFDRIFPGMFRPLAEMPEDLRAHVRYPEDLFLVQARMYAVYHMEDPQVFYNKEDKWHLATEKVGREEKPVEPYYVITRLPGDVRPEFILIMPFTPQNKKNMVAWLAARCDQPHYGRLLVYEFPKQELVYGPMQIEARIDQDATISQQISLWDQRGSQVIRGNLLVIPVKDALLYVEPLYLQAEQSRLPELRRVIVVHGERVVMEPTLDRALEAIFGGVRPAPERPPSAEPAAGIPELVRQARQLFAEAEARLKAGDWAGYGEMLSRLRTTLEELDRRVGAAATAP